MFIMVLVILILVGYGVLFMEKAQYNKAPKIIWTYWEEPDHLDPKKRLSDQATKAIRSWEEHNPTYEIIILNKKTYKGYVTIPEEIRSHPGINPDHLVDLIKLWILAERGGVWIDPEIILTKPLDLFPKYGEFSGFQSGGVIDPSVMACNKGSPFMTMWRDEFSQIVRYPSVDKYVESRSIRSNRTVIQIASLQLSYPMETILLQPVEIHFMEAKGNIEKLQRV